MALEHDLAGREEQELLKYSIAMTLLLAILSIAFGLWANSSSLTFDGLYSFTDAVMTYVALLAMRLIIKGENDRFQYGLWHVEPLLVFVNGLLLGITCFYAFINGITGFSSGGVQSQFGVGALFAALTCVVSLAMYGHMRKKAKVIDSDILATDARGWLVGGILNAALSFSFVAGGALSQSPYKSLTPYVDPLVLTIGSFCLLPFPILTIWSSAREILRIAPEELSEQVNEIAKTIVLKHGFKDYKAHVAKSGRQKFIEIGLVSATGDMTKSFSELDLIREEIAKEMGNLGPGYWLTVDFTADSRWI